jgi:hypothetical protein
MRSILFFVALLFVATCSATVSAAEATSITASATELASTSVTATALAKPVKVIGTILDASNRNPLIAATVQIEGTYRGTITNTDGEFILPIPEFPTVLLVRYIGYESSRIEVPIQPDEPLVIMLQPVTTVMEEVVVTGEDPAIRIMREVIRRKPLWRNQLETYIADAYTRQRLENDTGIVSITESESRAYWDRRRGTREVLLHRQQTSNMEVDQNFASATLVPNFYDDDIEISGFNMVGVTHPNALSYYNFKLEGIRELDGRPVYDILVTPRRRLQPTFEGTIAVLGEVYALIEVDLRPGESVMFPPPIQEFGLWYRQQFSNFGGDFWLPVDIRIEGNIKFGLPGLQFPPIKFSQLSRLANYEVNVPLPDTLFSISRRLLPASYIDQPDTSRQLIRHIPLDDREQIAYEQLDSTQTLEKAFEPTGALARFVRDSEERESRTPGFLGNVFKGFSPRIGYNRVDAAQLGASYSRAINRRLRAEVHASYYTGSEDVAYGAKVRYVLPLTAGTLPNGRPRQRPLRLEAGYQYETRHLYQESSIHPIMSSGLLLFGGNDYFDYSRVESAFLSASRRTRTTNLRWTVATHQQRHESLMKTTNYSIPGGILQRENPLIEPGIDRFGEIRVERGGDPTPFGVTGSQTALLSVRASDGNLGSDWSYVRLFSRVDWQFETFFSRRLFSNTLDIRAEVGYLFGDTPSQQLFGADTRVSYFTPFGSLRTASFVPVLSDASMTLFWEHNFRTIPFELIGFDWAVRKNMGIVAFGGHRWMNTPSSGDLQQPGFPFADATTHQEIGASLNGLFSVLRVDAAFRLDRPGTYVGISVARIF